MAQQNRINSLTEQQASLLLKGLVFLFAHDKTEGLTLDEKEDMNYLQGQLNQVLAWHRLQKEEGV